MVRHIPGGGIGARGKQTNCRPNSLKAVSRQIAPKEPQHTARNNQLVEREPHVRERVLNVPAVARELIRNELVEPRGAGGDPPMRARIDSRESSTERDQ